MYKFLLTICLFISLNIQLYSQCIGTQNVTVNPIPTYVGGVPTYLPGTTVNFTYTLESFTETSSNWLEGFDINFGNGWDLSTLTHYSPPVNCDDIYTIGGGNTGYWEWINNVIYYPMGNVLGPGWFFEASIPLGSYNQHPNNDFGDSNALGNCSWTFQFSIKTKDNCNSDQNLSVTITAGSDAAWGCRQSNQPCELIPFQVLPNNTILYNPSLYIVYINHN